jgi:hypothetical protein
VCSLHAALRIQSKEGGANVFCFVFGSWHISLKFM